MIWTTRTIGLSMAGAALIGGLGYVAFRSDPVPVDLVRVTAGPMQVTIDADGQTRIRDLYEVAAPIAGTALRAPVAIGDTVVAGQTVVARVEPASPTLLDARSRAQAEATVAEARAALILAQAELARASEEHAFAQTQFDRTQALADRGVASITQLETVTQQRTIAEAAVAAADARIAMAEATLARVEAALIRPDPAEDTGPCCVTLRAPVDGTVLSIATISEHPVQPGAPLLALGDPTRLDIVAELLSSDAVRIGPGTRALVERWGGPTPLAAVLTRIDPAATTHVSALGIEEQRVEARFDILTPAADRPGLGHGFSVFLRIVEWDSDRALQVPLGALFRRDDTWAVFVVDDGLAREQPVTLGRRGARMAQVLDGLTEGQIIITHPGDAVADGVAVIDRRAL